MQNITVEDISEYNLIFLVFCSASMLPSIQAPSYIWQALYMQHCKVNSHFSHITLTMFLRNLRLVSPFS